jgi:hypothetical protein
MKRFNTFLTSAAALLLASQSAHAALIILGNLPQTGDGSFGTVDSGTDDVGSNFNHVKQAVSFTMPPQPYSLDQASVRLRFYNTLAGDIAEVGFYQDNGSDFPGTLVGALLVSPPSASDDVGTFNFLPAAPLTLAASTKYWLVLDATAGEYDWRGSAPPIAPTSQIGATFGSQIGIVDGERRDLGPLISSFEIEATVPEPSVATLLLLGTLGVASRAIRVSLDM